MRCLLRFREGSITCSELWIRMARLLMYSCRSGVMESPQSVSLSVYCVNTKASHARLSRINCGATAWLIENWLPKRFTIQPSMLIIELSYSTNRKKSASGAWVSSNQWSKYSGFECPYSCVQRFQSRPALGVSSELPVFSAAGFFVLRKGSGGIVVENSGTSRFQSLTCQYRLKRGDNYILLTNHTNQ